MKCKCHPLMSKSSNEMDESQILWTSIYFIDVHKDNKSGLPFTIIIMAEKR